MQYHWDQCLSYPTKKSLNRKFSFILHDVIFSSHKSLPVDLLLQSQFPLRSLNWMPPLCCTCDYQPIKERNYDDFRKSSLPDVARCIPFHLYSGFLSNIFQQASYHCVFHHVIPNISGVGLATDCTSKIPQQNIEYVWSMLQA